MTAREVEPTRTRPPEAGTEREVLTGLLDFLHATVINKVAGLTDDQAFGSPVPPSTLSPAGVVKHLTGVERFWFSIDFAGHDLPWPWTEEDPAGQWQFNHLASSHVFAGFGAAVERLRTERAASGARAATANAIPHQSATFAPPQSAAAGPTSSCPIGMAA